MKWERIIATSLIIIACLFGISKCNKAKDQLKQYESIIDHKDAEIRSWIDDNGKKHATIKQLMLDNEVLYSLAQTKEVAKDLRIKTKQVRGSTKFITSIDTFFKVDTFYEDEYIYIRMSGDTVILASTDTFQLTEYWKRKWFLGQKHTYIDISNKNPYIKVDKISSYKVKPRNPTILISPYVGYDFITNRPSVGVCISLYRVSLKL